MTTIDLTPLYRNTIGFDRLASLLDNAFSSEQTSGGYPPYDIEVLDKNRYAISITAAGFAPDELEIQVERGVLSVKGKKAESESKRKFLYQGTATRAFERKFNLADYVEVVSAKLNNGMLTIELKHELPEALKPRRIEIVSDTRAIEHKLEPGRAA